MSQHWIILNEHKANGEFVISIGDPITGCVALVVNGTETHTTPQQQADARLLAEARGLLQAGKHLAVKLAECYAAAGIAARDCQAIVDFNEIIKRVEGR